MLLLSMFFSTSETLSAMVCTTGALIYNHHYQPSPHQSLYMTTIMSTHHHQAPKIHMIISIQIGIDTRGTILQSSTEAQLIAVTEAGKLALYLLSMLDDVGISEKSAKPLFEDNTAVIVTTDA